MHKSPFPANLNHLFSAVLAATLLVPVIALAIEPPDESTVPYFHALELKVHPSLVHLDRGSPQAAENPGLQRFFARHSNDWDVYWDERGNRPHRIQGRGIAMLPGRGNQLRLEDLGLAHGGPVQLGDVEQMVRGLIDEYPELFGVAQSDLVLDEERSANVGKNQQLWFIELEQHHNGIPVEGANVFFRFNNGNLIHFGNERIADVHLSTHATLDREAALSKALEAAGFDRSELSELIQDGDLKIIPQLLPGERVGHRYVGVPGAGYRHVLVRELVFRRQGDEATYKALVDAKNGQVLELVDENRYATVQGGVYPETYTDPEVTYGFPFATVIGQGTTDANGDYTYGGGTAEVRLDGQYTRINDNCGSISLSDSSTGDIDFGTSTGTDCTTPGFGGAGNTHSARTGFYHLTAINRIADTYLPTNNWLDSKLTANMNINNTCNAYWSGSTVNFYRSGGGCGNTGEIAAVFLHEWGHGLDANTGGGSDRATGETVGDTFAFTYTRNPCIGPGFRPGIDCYNCTDCTGVRDVADFAINGSATIAMPLTVTSNTGINCDRWTCPYIFYQGIMGYEGHCESYISSTAIWDLGEMLRAEHGTETGWDTLEQIWYDSLVPSKQAFQIVSGGLCNPSATTDGCASTNYYTVFLDVDDDDGNLSNGTPNGCRIWDAFDAHDIACGTRPACSGGTCVPTEDPEVSCSDGVDNDCDGLPDGADPDCGCLPSGAACSTHSDCCSNKCNPGKGICK